ncbi:MAG TPA: nuclear transport factor 2 family protein [Actinocrinis sp.]|uniref:nuclear transport factor 2 family protein n=1 Tax=Actinocrinis sp. TaxID=1920516 RepID=UPI002D3A0383|nr:nuclear transport factor 2 family protein [Actinocrinis sp.]HZU56166.1 nuclear transport factor 2 family protein [Actinocrinis sp.]
MSDLRDRYLACWNAVDADSRRGLLRELFAEDAAYVDPLVEVDGLDALDATIAAVQQQFPGFVFTPFGPLDAHHDVARFGWGLGPDGSEPVVVGFDVVTTGPDGRIRSVAGFLDRVPDA